MTDTLRLACGLYFVALLEELRVFSVAEHIAQLFMAGMLPIRKGEAADALYDYWRVRDERLDEDKRRSVYARAFGAPASQGSVEPNRAFSAVWTRFVASVEGYALAAEETEPDDKKVGASRDRVERAARELAVNLTEHLAGQTASDAKRVSAEAKEVVVLLSMEELREALEVSDLWQVVERVAGRELGKKVDASLPKEVAATGSAIMAWLSDQAEDLESGRVPNLPTPETVGECLEASDTPEVQPHWDCVPETGCQMMAQVRRWIAAVTDGRWEVQWIGYPSLAVGGKDD